MSVITERAARMRPRLLSLALFCIAAHGCSFEVETDSDSDVQSAVDARSMLPAVSSPSTESHPVPKTSQPLVRRSSVTPCVGASTPGGG